jgi:beta-lactamase regulating signal transducer with metallopeptidase domain
LTWLADARWLGLLAEYAVKTTAVLLLAVVFARLMHRKSAALRHFILSVFLVGLLLVPLVPSLHWGWETSLLPASAPAADESPAPEAVVRQGIAVESGIDRAEALPWLVAVEDRAAGSPPAIVRAAAPSTHAPGRLRNLLPKIWAAGLAVLLLRLLVGLAGAVRLSREARPLDDSAWQRLIFRFLSTVALRRRVRLKSHERIGVPLTWGIIRPVILMPDDSRNWDEDRRSSALFHEMSHIKRVDFAVMLLVRLSLAAFWFNPLSWAVFGMLKREQEKACDELVLRAGIKPSAYAASLLAFRRARRLTWNPAPALLGMFGANGMNDRLSAILRQKLTFKEIKMRTRIILTVIIVFVVALVGSARPAAPAPDREVSAAAAAPASATTVAEPAQAPQSVQEPSAVAPSQEAQEKQTAQEKAEAQERQKQKEEQKKKEVAAEKEAQEAKTVIVTTRKSKGGELEITVTEGDKAKTIVLDHPVVIESGEAGHAITLTLDGQEIVLKKGDQVRILAKDGTPMPLKEGEAWTVAGKAPAALRVKEKDGEGVIVYKFTPRPKTVKEFKVVAPEAAVATPAPPAPAGAPVPPAPPERVRIVTAPEARIVVGLGEREEEIQKKLRAIQERLNKLMEQKPDVREDLKSVQESLEELSERLEKTSKALEKIEVLGAKAPTAYTIVEPEVVTGAAAKIVVGEARKGDVAGIVSGDERGSSIFFKAREGLKDKAVYEKAVARIKKELPEGYTLDSKLDEESGTVTIKIKPPKGSQASDELLKKLLNVLKEELVKEPAAKR